MKNRKSHIQGHFGSQVDDFKEMKGDYGMAGGGLADGGGGSKK